MVLQASAGQPAAAAPEEAAVAFVNVNLIRVDRERVETGRTASAGQFFPAAGRGEALNLVNARYGAEPDVKAYSPDRFSPFATQTIPATVHEAPYILDGLLMNETGRRGREQYADTGGFTDQTVRHREARSSSRGLPPRDGGVAERGY